MSSGNLRRCQDIYSDLDLRRERTRIPLGFMDDARSRLASQLLRSASIFRLLSSLTVLYTLHFSFIIYTRWFIYLNYSEIVVERDKLEKAAKNAAEQNRSGFVLLTV